MLRRFRSGITELDIDTRNRYRGRYNLKTNFRCNDFYDYINLNFKQNIFQLFQNYFGDAWNVFDFIIVLGSFIDIVYSEVNVSKGMKVNSIHVICVYVLNIFPMYNFREVPVLYQSTFSVYSV